MPTKRSTSLKDLSPNYCLQTMLFYIFFFPSHIHGTCSLATLSPMEVFHYRWLAPQHTKTQIT